MLNSEQNPERSAATDDASSHAAGSIKNTQPKKISAHGERLMDFVTWILFRLLQAMSYKKFCADQLFDGYRLLDNQQVLITTDEGIVEAIVDVKEAGDEIQHYDGILSPGFINCHCHLELSHMRGKIAERTGLIEFVSQVMKYRHFAEADILQEIEKAEDEMLGNGIVAVGDICNNTLTLPQKEKGRIRYHNFIEASGFIPSMADQRFEKAVDCFYGLCGKGFDSPQLQFDSAACAVFGFG